MMKGKSVWRDFADNFWGSRLLVFLIFQFTVLHYYIHDVRYFSMAADYPATPWILPFLGTSAYFIFVYGISVVYFFSNIPFMQRHEMYAVMRMGQGKWFVAKIVRIWISAFFLAVLELFMSLVLLLPGIEWNPEWGKLFYSLSLTDASTQYGIKIIFSYDIIQRNTPITTMFLFLTEMILVTGLIGSLMFAIGIWLNRTVAVLVGMSISVLAIVYENVGIWCEGLNYISLLSWLNMLLPYGERTAAAPTYMQTWVIGAGIEAAVCVLAYLKIKKSDFDWIDEE